MLRPLIVTGVQPCEIFLVAGSTKPTRVDTVGSPATENARSQLNNWLRRVDQELSGQRPNSI